MKFISWNVNGLRACVQKGFLDFFNSANADFFCLQETKLQEGQITLDLPGYEQYWCYAEKKGYSGTAIFAKNAPIVPAKSPKSVNSKVKPATKLIAFNNVFPVFLSPPAK